MLDYIRMSGYLEGMFKLTSVFQSLEDDTRLRILALLMDAGELCVCDLIAILQLPQSTVSRHLSHLKNAGWLQDRRAGVWVYYSIVKQPGALQQALLPTLRTFLQQQEVVKQDLDSLAGLAKGSSCA